MTELDYQRALIKVIIAHGGFAFKSSNRFLVGVADVFFTIDWPYGNNGRGVYASGFLECKLDKVPARNSFVTLGTTVKQRQFLENVHEGGARAGVMSFIVDRHQFGACIAPPEMTAVDIQQYDIGARRHRDEIIWNVFERWLNDG